MWIKILSDGTWQIQVFPSLVCHSLQRSVGVQQARTLPIFGAGRFQWKISYMGLQTHLKLKMGVSFVLELGVNLQIEVETSRGTISARIYRRLFLEWQCRSLRLIIQYRFYCEGVRSNHSWWNGTSFQSFRRPRRVLSKGWTYDQLTIGHRKQERWVLRDGNVNLHGTHWAPVCKAQLEKHVGSTGTTQTGRCIFRPQFNHSATSIWVGMGESISYIEMEMFQHCEVRRTEPHIYYFPSLSPQKVNPNLFHFRKRFESSCVRYLFRSKSARSFIEIREKRLHFEGSIFGRSHTFM